MSLDSPDSAGKVGILNSRTEDSEEIFLVVLNPALFYNVLKVFFAS